MNRFTITALWIFIFPIVVLAIQGKENNTASNVISVPFLEDFSTAIVPALPAGWTGLVENGSHWVLMETTFKENPGSLPHHFIMNPLEYSDATLILVSPRISQPLNSVVLRFDAEQTLNPATLIIGTMANPDNSSSFNPIAQVVPPYGVYGEFIVDFSGYTGTHRYIGFKHSNENQFSNIYLDNISFENYMQLTSLPPLGEGSTMPAEGTSFLISGEPTEISALPGSGYTLHSWEKNGEFFSSEASTTISIT